MTLPRRGLLIGGAAILAALLLLAAAAFLVVGRMEANPSMVAAALVGSLERGLKDAGRPLAADPGTLPGIGDLVDERGVAAESLLKALGIGFRAAGLPADTGPGVLRPSLKKLDIGLFPPRMRLEGLSGHDDGKDAPTAPGESAGTGRLDPFRVARAEIGLDWGLFPPRCAPHVRLENLTVTGGRGFFHAKAAEIAFSSWPDAADMAKLVRSIAGIVLEGARLDILQDLVSPGDGAEEAAPGLCAIRVTMDRFGFQGDGDAPRAELSGLAGAIRFMPALPDGRHVPARINGLLKAPDAAFRTDGSAVLRAGGLSATELRLDGPEITIRRPLDELVRLFSRLLPEDPPPADAPAGESGASPAAGPIAANLLAANLLADGCRMAVSRGGIALEADGARAGIDGLAFQAELRSGTIVLPDADIPEPDRGVNGVLRLEARADDAPGGGLDAVVPFRILVGRPNPSGRAESGSLILTGPEIAVSAPPGALGAPLARLSALAGIGGAPDVGSGIDIASLLPETCTVETDGARLRIPGLLDAVVGLALRGSPGDAAAEFSFDGELDCGGAAGVPIRLKGGAHGALRPAGSGADGPSGTLAFTRTELALAGDEATLEEGLLDVPAGGPWSLTGRMTSGRFGLTRWLGILRRLTPGLQAILDDFADAEAAFRLDGTGLDVHEARTRVAGLSFRGSLGVASWTNPVLALDMRTEEEIDILTIFPEIGRQPIQEPGFAHRPLTEVLSPPDSEGEEAANGLILGYDILLGAKRVILDPADLAPAAEAFAAHARRIVLDGPAVRIAPDRAGDPRVSVEKGAILGGSLTGGVVFGGDARTLTCRISADLRHADAGALAGILPDSPFASGRLRASAVIDGRVRDDDPEPAGTAFLKSLRGTASMTAERGRLVPKARGILDRFERCSAEAAFLDRSGGRGVVRFNAALLAALGNGRGRLEARAGLDGPVILDGRDGPRIADAPVTAALKLTGPAFPRPLSATFDARIGLRPAAGILEMRRAALELPGATLMLAKVEARLAPTPSWTGLLYFSSANLADLAPLLGGLSGGRLPDIPAEFRNPLLDGEFRGDAAHFAMTDLVAVAGPVRLSGSAGLRWDGAAPMLTFDLGAESIDCDEIAGILARSKDGPGTPWNLRPMRAFDGRGGLRVAALRARDLKFSDVRIPLRLHGGTLGAGSPEARGHGPAALPIRAGLYGGSLRAALSCVFHDAHADLEAAAELGGIDIGEAGGDFLRSHLLEGRMTAGAEIGLRISGPDGTGRTLGERILPTFRGSWHAGMEKGSLTRLRDGLPMGRTSTLVQAHAAGVIENGIIRSRSLRCLDGPLEIVGGGDSTFNLGSRAISVSLRVRRGRLIDIPFSLSGRLDDNGGKGAKALIAYSIDLRETVMNMFRGMFGMTGAPAAPPAWNHTRNTTEPQS